MLKSQTRHVAKGYRAACLQPSRLCRISPSQSLARVCGPPPVPFPRRDHGVGGLQAMRDVPPSCDGVCACSHGVHHCSCRWAFGSTFPSRIAQTSLPNRSLTNRCVCPDWHRWSSCCVTLTSPVSMLMDYRLQRHAAPVATGQLVKRETGQASRFLLQGPDDSI